MPQVIDSKGKALKDIAVPEAFSTNVSGKTNAIFRAVFRELASPRAGTHSTLKRDEVRGGGRKPWKQKGTGRARQGSIRSPQWRHGGVVFGPQPRSYVSALNKKERKAALLAALSDKYQNGQVTLLQTDKLDLKKTKDFATVFFGSPKAAKSAIRTLIVFAESELATVGESLARTGNNIVNVAITHTGALDIKDIVGYTHLIVTAAANDALIARFAENGEVRMNARDIIVAPVITEKSMTGTAYQQYAFEVNSAASKTQIKIAINEIFKVTVIKINTVNVLGKSKNFARRGARTTGKQSDWKKAIVTLAPGQKIELGGVNYFEQ